PLRAAALLAWASATHAGSPRPGSRLPGPGHAAPHAAGDYRLPPRTCAGRKVQPLFPTARDGPASAWPYACFVASEERRIPQSGWPVRPAHGQGGLLPARGPRPRGLALAEAQLLAEQEELQGRVTLRPRAGVDQVEEERAPGVEGQAGQGQAPLVARGVGR